MQTFAVNIAFFLLFFGQVNPFALICV